MLFSDVSVDRRCLLTAKTTVRTLKSWFVAALVIHVSIFVSLQGETATALLTLKRLRLVRNVYLCAPPFRGFARFQTTFPDSFQSALQV